MLRTHACLASIGIAAAVALLASPAATAVAASAAPSPAAAAPSPAAAAASAVPGGSGTFGTWRAAQRAAGFRLKHPTRQYGLRRAGRISVQPCAAPGRSDRRDVVAQYLSPTGALLGLEQDNAGVSCTDIGRTRKLGTYRIHGVRATLAGACGSHGLPACSSRAAFLFLSWKIGAIYYRASSYNEPRGTLRAFASNLAY